MQLTLPGDARFWPLATAMARRVAQSLGFSAEEAIAFGQALADESVAAARRAKVDDCGSLDVTFDLSGPALRARAQCAGVTFEVTRPLPGV
jgi:hypothetical protein